MSGATASDRAVGLAWLRPSPAALLALTADDFSDPAPSDDPALLVHLLRYSRPSLGPDSPIFAAAVLRQPSIAAAAASLIEGFPSSQASSLDSSGLVPVNQVARAAASVAGQLASALGGCHPEAAACLARLAPLGWYAVHAVAPAAVAICEHGRDPSSAQRGQWGLDAAAITRRLASRWRLPTWVASTLGHLQFHPNDAVRAGAHPALFRVVRAAVAAAEGRFGTVGLTGQLSASTDDEFATEASRLVGHVAADTPPSGPSVEPIADLYLVRLLRATAAARRASGAAWLRESEDRIDRLTDAVAAARDDFDTAVRDAKLTALAEFAAGASHEINNPLAVISGQAQLLLGHEADPGRQKQLGSIVRQTRRLHELLHGTLQFARPCRPTASVLDVSEVLTQAAADLRAEGDAKSVALDVPTAGAAGLRVRADAGQVRQAVSHLVRNAIEAAPAGGTVVLRAEQVDGGVEIAIEDDGPGPDPGSVAHLFDPFFSGRSAGRGRGLGLSITWRFARINGGDVRYEPRAAGLTRFVLTLPVAPPLATHPSPLSRLSA